MKFPRPSISMSNCLLRSPCNICAELMLKFSPLRFQCCETVPRFVLDWFYFPRPLISMLRCLLGESTQGRENFFMRATENQDKQHWNRGVWGDGGESVRECVQCTFFSLGTDLFKMMLGVEKRCPIRNFMICLILKISLDMTASMVWFLLKALAFTACMLDTAAGD